jgi:ribonuclease D
MKPKTSIPMELLTTTDQVLALSPVLSQENMVAIDTESDSRHRYPEKVCLIQIATSKKVYLIDTLSIVDLTPIGDLLRDPNVVKVIQGADYDIRCLDRQWSFRIRNIFDTSIAARFAGMKKFGLSSLTESLIGVQIEKDARLQKSDWSRRPFTSESLNYAATDVWYLSAIRKALEEKLDALKRNSWVTEECSRLEQIRYVPTDPDIAFLSVKGVSKLDGQERAIFRRLYTVREAEARRRNRPPYYVLSHESLVQLASNPDTHFSEIRQLRGEANGPLGSLLRSALRAGIADPPLTAPKHTRKTALTPVEMERLRRLKEWRTDEANALGMEPSLVWPMISLERLARAPGSLAIEIENPEVRHWQRERFLEHISYALA